MKRIWLSVMAVPLAWIALAAWAPPSPPEQPLSGPGGRAYLHADVVESHVGEGAQEATLFEPAGPTPARAPVVVLCHGWGAVDDEIYGLWISHIVRRGFTVIYPRYQTDLRTPVPEFMPNAMAGVTRALDALAQPGHVAPDGRGLAFVGHSMGGLVAANLAVRAARGQLPPPLALMSIMPGKTWPEASRIAMPLEDLSLLPPSLLLVTLAGEDDDFVGDIDARKVYLAATNVPRVNRDYVRMFSDNHGVPALVADHRAPSTWNGAADALDYYGTWKLFDGLTDAVFRGVHREYALGNTPEQRDMGVWSDRVPVRQLIVGEP